ncbi:hypothetical protein FCV55_10995 [Vibrio sp. F13]|uniref:hypothetical protein n=1 Tax=Vibrio sp. F13 TaxID=2070777 RepID=UPI0010BDD137|nr:hypothetical protein [Vibrio sp. F13]TKF69778.1 hypothetical protein FCV55_10995 [Vibrio sp. F13]
MTAEIAVYNKSAVALAADSAVTVTGGNFGSKIYNGAEKLFALTKHHPVGIMVYGTGDLCGVPWELIIKQYRKKLQTDHFDTLEEYAIDFWEFLKGSSQMIPADLREFALHSSFAQAFNYLLGGVDLKAKQLVDSTGVSPNERETIQFFDDVCTEIINNLDAGPFFEGFDSQDVVDLTQEVDSYVDGYLSQVLPDVTFSGPLKTKFSLMLRLVACKQNILGVNTGVVFAGYGDKEYFPVVLAFKVQGFSNGKLRFAPNLEKSAAAGQSGLHAYAQEDEVKTFTQGVNPVLLQAISDSFNLALNNIQAAMGDLIDAHCNGDEDYKLALKQQFLDCREQNWQQVNETVSTAMRSNHFDKVTQMIEFLPKDELAYMSESLVNMTAFKRKVSNDTETVGGPIDVAIISKGDGFIWVKRKHYFNKELNSHYFNDFL